MFLKGKMEGREIGGKEKEEEEEEKEKKRERREKRRRRKQKGDIEKFLKTLIVHAS